MVNFTSKFFTIIELLCSIILILPVITKCENYDDWVHPDAWSLSSESESYTNDKKNSHQSYCNTQNIEEKIASIYYKKLIKNLFNREKFEYNEKTDSYYRNIQFVLNKFQFDKLEELKDFRNLDSIVNKILLNAQTFEVSEKSSVFVSIWDAIWNAIWNGINTIYSKICSVIFSISQIRFELFIIIIILLVIYVKRMHGVSLIIIIAFGLFFSGYIYKYYECNRKLEVDQIIEYHDMLNMPCSENKRNEDYTIWNLWGLLSTKPSRAQCLEYLRKKNKIRLPYCRPDDVFFKYINEIILNQFQMTVEKSTYIFKEINELIPFPYNIVAVMIFCSILIVYLQLSFKYILSPYIWLPYLRNRNNHNYSSSTHHDDKISGENLKLFLEIFKSTKTQSTNNILNEKNKNVETINIITSGIQILAPLPSTSKDIHKNGLNEKINTDYNNETINLDKTSSEILINSNKNDTIKSDIVTISHQNCVVSNDVQNNKDDKLCDLNLEEKDDDIVMISSDISVILNENIVNMNNSNNNKNS